jgi:hypothetical protein
VGAAVPPTDELNYSYVFPGNSFIILNGRWGCGIASPLIYMRTITLLLVLICILAGSGLAQIAVPAKPTASVKADADPADLAKAALTAHGGEKLKQMRSLLMRGSVDLNVNNQSIPATFYTVISGDKYSFEINNPFQPLKQVYDGHQTFSTIRGFSLPPITSLGFPLLPKVGENGFVISPVGDLKKKKKGFRITTPDGFYTDFFVDEKTGQIKGYESSYEVSGRSVTTSVEIDEFQTVDGIVVPKKYSQRFDLGQMTAYASFKIKEILINSTIADDVFDMPGEQNPASLGGNK